ncbi:hypothetical protein H9Q69_001892 [Fusarium xylarioides]|nr:hypothetical protein H9Q69_001892 [Fusarium xylarioides]
MQVVQYVPFMDSDFKIIIQSSKAKSVIPKVLLKPCPSFIEDIAEASDGEDEGQTVDVPDGLCSDSVVARSMTEPEVESELSPEIEDNKTGTVRGWNRRFFGKEEPQEAEKKGFQIEIHVKQDIVWFICCGRFLHPAVGSVLEASDYGWDAVALAIVVNAIHGQYQYVPYKIDIDLFTKIAFIADRMKCGEALHMAAKVWYSNIHDRDAVDKLDSTCLMWLYVAWVFFLEKVSKSTGRLLAMGYQGPQSLELNGLPLQGIVEKFDKMRQSKIQKILQKLNRLRNSLLVEEGCPHEKDVQCSMMTLGYLRRLECWFGELDPPLVSPFTGYSIQDVCSMIETFSQQGINDEAHGHDHGQEEHPCTIRGRMYKNIQSIKKDVDALCGTHYDELWEYPGRIWDVDSE